MLYLIKRKLLSARNIEWNTDNMWYIYTIAKKWDMGQKYPRLSIICMESEVSELMKKRWILHFIYRWKANDILIGMMVFHNSGITYMTSISRCSKNKIVWGKRDEMKQNRPDINNPRCVHRFTTKLFIVSKQRRTAKQYQIYWSSCLTTIGLHI